MATKSDLAAVIARAAPLHFGAPRFAGYLNHCGGDAIAALILYQWSIDASGAMWETLDHLEVALRNHVATRLATRHSRLGRAGSWLDDPANELDQRALDDIESARRRIRRKQKPIDDGQIIAELGFGFWRFLLARRHASTLWPDIATGFPYAPDRRRETVEAPVVRLHEFRNRLAHHERIWNQPIRALYADVLTVLRFMNPDLAQWVHQQNRVQALLGRCPQPRPYA